MKTLNQIANEIKEREERNKVLFFADLINGIIFLLFGIYLSFMFSFIL